MKWLKRLLFLLFATAVIAAFVYAFRPQPVAVEFAQPVRGSMQVTSTKKEKLDFGNASRYRRQ